MRQQRHLHICRVFPAARLHLHIAPRCRWQVTLRSRPLYQRQVWDWVFQCRGQEVTGGIDRGSWCEVSRFAEVVEGIGSLWET